MFQNVSGGQNIPVKIAPGIDASEWSQLNLGYPDSADRAGWRRAERSSAIHRRASRAKTRAESAWRQLAYSPPIRTAESQHQGVCATCSGRPREAGRALRRRHTNQCLRHPRGHEIVVGNQFVLRTRKGEEGDAC